jgi:hypothetical protein
MLLSWGALSFAASKGSGQAFGLLATANVLSGGVNLNIPFADTELQNAPPDFNKPAHVAQVGVDAGILSVGTGVIDTSTQSLLSKNSVVSTTKVDGLKLGLLGQNLLGAGVITSEARMTCENGVPKGSGDTKILQGTGWLENVSLGVNTDITLADINVLGLAKVGATIRINEQIPSGNKMVVNAVRIQVNASLLADLLGKLLSLNVTVGHAEATMDDCKPSVTLNPLPPITVVNQAAVPVSGTCSAGSNDVAMTSAPAGVQQTLACAADSTFLGTVNATQVNDGQVIITATQTVSGQPPASASQTTTKVTTSTPVVTISQPPFINAANQSSYGVSGTCSANGTLVNVSIGGVAASANCSNSAWSVTGVNVSSVPDGSVTVSASQMVGNLQGTATPVSTSKDATPPTVAVTSAPAITTANQSSYVVSGTCTENGMSVSVNVGGIPAVPAPTCSGGTWTAPGVDASGLPTGQVTITVSQVDSAGNTGSGTRTTTKDAAQSAVSVTSAPAINVANQSSYGGVAGTCSASGGQVSVAIGSVNATAACSGGNWSVSGVNVKALPDGAVKVTATQTIGGSPVSGTRMTTKDATAPSVSIITAPTIDGTNQSSYSASGTCTTGDGVVTVQIGSIKVTATCVNGTWSISGVKVGGLPKGKVTITASQTDAAGNTGSSSREVDKTTDSDGSIGTVTDPLGAVAPQNGTWIISAELNGEPGRGMGIDVQNGTLFMQVYNYLSTGAPTFHTAVGKLEDNKVTAPLLFFKGGRYFGSGAIDGQQAGSAGDVEVTFTSRTTGTIKFPGETAVPMQRYDYEGTPANVFADPALVDRWAIAELTTDNRPIRVWWADIGTSDQVKLNYDWTGSTRAWPYSSSTQLTVHGFDGTLTAPIFAACDYSGASRLFNCTGDSISAQGTKSSVTLALQRSLDQLSGTIQVANGDKHRIVGMRITRSGYKEVNGKTERAVYFPAHSAPESGTWVISSELNGKAGRGMTLDQQKPANAAERMVFMSVYDYVKSGDSTFHSAFGALDQASSSDLELIQYKGGRYFGSSEKTATFLENSGKVEKHSYVSPVLGTVEFPGEDEVLNERYYFGIESDSVNSLVGSWALLSSKAGVRSMFFNFVPGQGGTVIDQTTGYTCSKEVFKEFDFRCVSTTPGSTDPVLRFTPAYFSAAGAIVGDGDPATAGELTLMRVRDAGGKLVQSGSLFPAK